MVIVKDCYHHLKEFSKSFGCVVREDEPMKNHTSFKIGGPAKLFVYVNNDYNLKLLLKFMYENQIPFFTIGKGTNLLVSDDGYDGVVISLEKSENNIEVRNDIMICSAGISMSKACVTALQNNLSGLEFAWGIPGTCGGALFMNAGAYGEDMSRVVIEGEHLTPEGVLQKMSSDNLKLSYRSSYYSDKPYIIKSVKMKLNKSDPIKIKSKMNENISKRKSSQPLEYPNAGSIFKRPKGDISAGKLIEECGLKGLKIGGASISNKHGGFIINEGNATSSDVTKLISEVKKRVLENYGISLECEIKTLGNV